MKLSTRGAASRTKIEPVPIMLMVEQSTPAVAIDESIAVANIRRVQAFFDTLNMAFRPHIKTHKMPYFARLQVDAGATGINAQKISEASVFSDAGFDDILITYNVIGDAKLRSLGDLHNRIAKLSVVADSAEVVEGLASVGSADHPLTVLVECDVGGGRCGVQTPAAAAALARRIADKGSLRFGGLLTYPKAFTEAASEWFFERAIGKLAEDGLAAETISYGGTPSLFSAGKVPSVTEYRAGTYIFNDRSLLAAGACTLDQCALRVVATVVSRPTADRAILDAGSKTLSSDLLGMDGYGLLVDYPEAKITSLSEEHAIVDLQACGPARPSIGERVSIIPNHACVVINLATAVFVSSPGAGVERRRVEARGMVY